MKDYIIQSLLISLEQAKSDMQLTLKMSDDKTAVHHLPTAINGIEEMLQAVRGEIEKLKDDDNT